MDNPTMQSTLATGMAKRDWPDRPDSEKKWNIASSYAPLYKVPRKAFVSVEHPYIIQNIDKGMDLLGGPTGLQKLVQESKEATGTLYLRPGDRMSKSILSTNVITNDILLAVTLPKRTGLKRKRGSQGPFLEADNKGKPSSERPAEHVDVGKGSQDLVRAMRENPTKYRIQPVGMVDNTHRFRGMPDFVSSSTEKPFMQKMQEHILPFNYEKMKGFTLDMGKGVKPNTEIIPPPRLSHLPLPFNYAYRQNPSVKQVVNELGNATTINIHAAPKIWNQPVPFDIAEVPIGPADIPPIETLPPAMQRLIASASRLMEDRPIFTRRALMNSLSGSDWENLGQNVAKHIYQYVGYMFASGPWRDGVVKFGVDPRKDPACREYQTMMFMLEKEPKDSRARWVRTKNDPKVVVEAIRKKESHLFDGQTVSKDGKVWQVCDITDPFMKKLLATTNLRKECDIQSDGWYHNGTWAKAKIFMKHKISNILEGLPSMDAAYANVAREMPDIITKDDKTKATMGKGASSLEVGLATSIRAASLSYLLINAQKVAKVIQGNKEEEHEDREEREEQEGEANDDDEGEEESEGDEDEDEGEMELPLDTRDVMIDPRLTETGVELERPRIGSDQDDGIADEMLIDGK